MKKKKILFIHNWMVCGGIEKVLLSIFNRFDYSKFDVELLLVYNEGEFLNDLPKEVKLKYLYSKHSCFLEKINFNLLSRFAIDWGCRVIMYSKTAVKYDVIISFQGGTPLRYHTYITLKASKNISWVHTDMYNNRHTIDNFFTEQQEKESYDKMDKIMFVSNDAKKQFEKLYPENKVCKDVIFNPIEKDLIGQYRKAYKKYSNDRCFNIVSVGRLSGEKGFDRLVRLTKQLKLSSYNFHIDIIGDGYKRKELEDLIVAKGVEEHISLLGYLNLPYRVMADADLFVSSSFVEGYPLVLCEAFCLGLPIVATKVTGSLELIDNDKYGLLTDHDDDSIYQAVKKMIEDDSLREHYHKKSLERAETLDIEKVMSQIYSML